jgi:hypothetical protein
VVEKPDLAHARARVRNPLDKVLRKRGISAFQGLSAQRGGPESLVLPRGFLSERDNRTCAGVGPRMAGTSAARARARAEPHDKVLRKSGNSAFWGYLVHSGEA